MAKYCIVSLINNPRRNKDSGELEDAWTFQFFDPKSIYKDSDKVGIIPVDKTLESTDLTRDDFIEVPYFYDVKSKQVPKFKGKPETKITRLEPISSFDFFKPLEANQDACIVIGAEYYEYGSPKVRLTKIFVLDPNFEQDDNYLGFPIVAYNLFNYKLTDFPKLPGYYQLDIKEERGKYGRGSSSASEIKFIASLTSNTTGAAVV